MSVEKALVVQAGSMNGLKLILGAALVVVAGQMQVLSDLVPILPDYSAQLQSIIGWVKVVIKVLEWILQILGNGLIGLGGIHKLIKLVG
jgi:hypothetical protein